MYTGSEYSGKFVLPDGQKGKCNSSNVNVRTSPTTTSGNNVLFQVHNGYQFTILQEQNGWYQVSFGADRIGWISGLYVTLI
ncbi:MAG: SH3 domain-containing protein [Acutalibacteraceae bacterium]